MWLIPVLGFPDSYTTDLRDRLGREFPLRIRASLETGKPEGVFFPDHKQIVAEKAMEAFRPVVQQLPLAKPNTVYIFLLAEDLNRADRRFRFLFSVNDAPHRVAIVSLARMAWLAENPQGVPSVTKMRLYKMVKRQIGELYFGHSRSTNPSSVMYSPLMSLDDLDMIGTDF